jgi:hypothetical protein
MALVEYLYVDEKRLDTYFEQISPPVTYDKVPEWNAEISFTGPKGGGKQARFARPYSRHEKIAKLTKHLEDEGLVGGGRQSFLEPSGEDPGSYRHVFHIETCQATRVSIPTTRLDSTPVNLSLWISFIDRRLLQPMSQEHSDPMTQLNPQLRKPWNLYLLEDYRGNDESPLGLSTYSSLSLLLGSDELRSEEARSEEARWGPRLSDQRPQLFLEFGDHEDEVWAFHRSYSVDPTEAFSQLGAQVGSPRQIRTLYRVRAHFVDLDSDPRTNLATIGYPIFIAEDTDPI